MSYTVTQTAPTPGIKDGTLMKKGDDRSGSCRSAPATAVQRGTSVPLDYSDPGRWSLDSVRITGGKYHAAINGTRPLPAGNRPAASGGRLQVLTRRHVVNTNQVGWRLRSGLRSFRRCVRTDGQVLTDCLTCTNQVGRRLCKGLGTLRRCVRVAAQTRTD
jgi:hypothetical protein